MAIETQWNRVEEVVVVVVVTEVPRQPTGKGIM